MKKQKQSLIKRVSLILAAVIIANLIAFQPATAYASAPNFVYPGFTINYSVTNSWADNQNVQITVTNTGNAPIRNWALQYEPCGTIVNLWGGEIFNDNTVKNAFYNADIAAGANISFGYTLTGVTGTPGSFTLASYRVPKLSGYTAVLSVINNWDTGFTGFITLTNTTNDPIMAWEFGFDTNFTVTHTETFSILENTNDHYKVTGGYNGNIPANSSVTLEFNADSGLNPAISNISLTEMIVSGSSLADYDFIGYIPWLPEGLGNLVAFGFYDQLTNSIVLEWAYQDNSGDFEIYAGENEIECLITTVNGEKTYSVPVDGETDEYVFIVRKHTNADNLTLTSNEVIMRLNEAGLYYFVPLDADEDGLPDLYELIIGTDHNNPDTDGDGLPDGYEVFVLRTDLLKFDTNDNGIPDADEDFDEDGLANYQEYLYGTSPFNPDTDEDGINDGDEVNVYFTDPLNPDADGDGLFDGDDVALGFDPLNPRTFNGILDSEYPVSFEITKSDLSELNGKITEFDIEISANATNNFKKYLSVYTRTDDVMYSDNKAIIGAPISLAYDEGDVTDCQIKFYLNDNFLNSNKSFYPELNLGIDRYNVFFYDEEIGAMLPVACAFDEVNKAIITQDSVFGTIFLVDLEALIYDLGIDYNETDTEVDEIPVASLDGFTGLSEFSAPTASLFSLEAFDGVNAGNIQNENDGDNANSNAQNSGNETDSVIYEELAQIIGLTLTSENNVVSLPDSISPLSIEPFSTENPSADSFAVNSESGAAATAASVFKQVDLTLVIDTTGSMGSYINTVKRNIAALISDLRAQNIFLYVSIVEFKDITCDGINSTRVNPGKNANFLNNVADMLDVLNGLRASGGGDAPETVIDGLGFANKLPYRANAAKFAFVITDINYKNDNTLVIQTLTK